MQDEQDFYAEKQRLQQELQASKKEISKLQVEMRDILIDNALKTAFTESGGRMDDVSSEDISSFDVVRAYLENRIELKGKQIVFKDKLGNTELDSEGQVKTDNQKMLELKQSATFKPFFL